MSTTTAIAEATIDDRATALVRVAELVLVDDIPEGVVHDVVTVLAASTCGDRLDLMFDDLVEAVRRRQQWNAGTLTAYDFGCLPGPNSVEAAEMVAQEGVDGALWPLLFGPARMCAVCRVSPRRTVTQIAPAVIDNLCHGHATADGLRGRACTPVPHEQVKDGDDGARGGHTFRPEPLLRPAPLPGGGAS